MGKKKLTVTGTGDALFVAPFPEYYSEQLSELAKEIQACDVKITNLETNLSDFEYAGNAYSGGTWINTKRAYLEDLKRYGFNFYGTANNHAMDYGHEGLLSTLQTLDEHGLAHAGTGDCLENAEKPAILHIDEKKVAIFAVDTSFNVGSKAGRANKYLKGRAGVNYLRFSESFCVTPTQMEQLKDIAKTTRINFYHELLIATGFRNPNKEGEMTFGDKLFTLDETVPSTKCNKSDLQRITGNIQKAKEENDYVFILIHCHKNDNSKHSSPAEFMKELSKACIDAGASAIFGGGCHELRPIEIYRNKPIFYSLDDFIYQGLRVEYLPADFMEQFGADINLSAEEALYVRSRGDTVGLHKQKENYLSVLPKIEFTGEEMTDLTLFPLSLNFDEKDLKNGLPKIAKGEEAVEILNIVNELSAPYGTQFKMVDGAFKIK